MDHKAYLALGSNLGDREGCLFKAIQSISNIARSCLINVSNIYETEPVGYTDQGRFLNMAVLIQTALAPLQLLDELQKIESELKRTREIRWGPRTIDIDILLYDNCVINHPRLTIPHPRMFERAFALIPLMDIYKDRDVHGFDIKKLIDQCSDRAGVRLYREFGTESFKL